MMKNKIGWCDATWNPVFGCNNGCKYCYARKLSFRFAKEFAKIHGLDPDIFRNFDPVWLEKNFNKTIPKNATHIFVNSMSDVMYWKSEWIEKVLRKTQDYPEKKFLFLTKSFETTFRNIYHVLRSKLLDVRNIYVGVTAENQKDIENINFIPTVDSLFVSIEPIQERIDLNAIKKKEIKQIIVGAETGNRKEKVIPKAEWIEEIREYCQKNGVKLFEKDSLRDIVKRDLIQEKI